MENIDKFIESIQGTVLIKGSAEYTLKINQRWNIDVVNDPLLIVMANNADDCIKSVNYARDNKLPIGVIAGSHGMKSVVVNGLLLNVSQMKGISVDAEKKILVVEAGCTLGETDNECSKYGLAIPLGHVSHTGLAGLTLGGGIGHLSRSYGLTTDSLIQVKLVDYNGELKTINKETNPDLLYAIRSSGSNFGVVTEFTFNLHPCSNVFVTTIIYPVATALEPLTKIGEFAATTPNELAIQLSISMEGAVVQLIYNGPEADGKQYVDKVIELGGNVQPVMSTTMPYVVLQKIIDNKVPHGLKYYQRGPFIKVPLNESIIKIMLDGLVNHPTKACAILLTQLGGAVKIQNDESSFAHRDSEYQIIFLSIIIDDKFKPAIIQWTNDVHVNLKPYSFGDYSNTTDDNQPLEEIFGKHTSKLVDLKTKYDPTNFFKNNTNIKPNITN